ncbi:MAG: YitT family protein [Clostridia bacterium]|nr:YitT family protein [Clostridia bacterium]
MEKSKKTREKKPKVPKKALDPAVRAQRRKKRLTALKNVLEVILGTAILAFGTAVFIVPFDLVVGGVSSVALITNRLLGDNAVSIDLLITVLTWSLFFLGLVFLGKGFALKTLVSTVVYPVAFSLFSRLVDPEVLGGVFCLSLSEYSQIALLLACIFGGVFIGAGCALTFLGGGSSGGMDIIAFLICKIFKRLKSPRAIFFIDAVTVAAGLFVFLDPVLTLLGISSAFVSAFVIDKMFLGGSKAFVAEIVSDEFEKINRQVAETLERTTSIADIEGGYSGQKKKMLFVSFTMDQYNQLLNIINKTDPSAFVTIQRAHEINGEGWTR